MSNSVIRARFQLGYGGFQLAVDLALPSSGIAILLGPSGCGKTILLRCMAGLEHPSPGFFSINGNIWQDSENNLFVPAHQRNLGYVFQEANLFPHLTVAKNLQFGLERSIRQKRERTQNATFNTAIELLGIGHLLGRMPDRLSGGEKQRVAIARALVLNPAILLMDEPLASLDLKRKQEIMPYLLTLQKEFSTPIVYVTHSQEEAAQLADYLVLLDNGQVQASGAVSDTFGRIDLPLAKEKQAAVAWQAVITSHEPEFRLTNVDFDGGVLSLPMIDAPPGTKLRIQLHARDVSLTLQRPEHTSILNVLAATITEMTENLDGQTVVQLKVGQHTLLSHVTRKSMQQLALKPGLAVYAQIKGTSLLP